MPTKNLVPRQDGEGKIGVKGVDLTLKWKEINAVSGSLDTIKLDEIKNQQDNDLLKAGSGVTITRANDAQDGFQYTISASTTGFADKIEEGQAKVEVVDTVGNDDATIQFWADPDNDGASEKIWEFDKDGHLIPETNALYDIGKAEKKVRHLFLSDNSLHIGTTSTDTSAYASGGNGIYKLGKNNLHKLVWNSNNAEKTVAMEEDLHAVAFSGNYDQLINKPTVPSSSDDITSDHLGINYTGASTDNLTTHLSGIDTVLGTINTALGTKVTQADIDSAIQGLDVKESVRVATTGVLTGFSYVNATTQQWQETNASGALTIDDVVLSNGDRVLVKNATAQTQNGIYVVSGIDGSSQVILDRSADLDNSSDFGGAFTFVEEGTTNIGNSFVAKNASSPNSTTVGTNTQNWTQFNSAGSVTALNDLSDVSFTPGGVLTINGLNTLNLPDTGSINDGILSLKNGGANESEVRLYCGSSNSHYVGIKSPTHAQFANANGTYTLTLPASNGNSGQFLQTDGSGVLSWASQSSDFEVKAATTTGISASDRGFSGQVGYIDVASPLTIDGVTIYLNDKVLIKDKIAGVSDSGFFNGVYYYKSLTSGTIRLELLRGAAYNYNINNDFTCRVLEGAVNKFKTFAVAKTVTRAENPTLAPTSGVTYYFFEDVSEPVLTRISENSDGRLTHTPLLSNKADGDEAIIVTQVDEVATILGVGSNSGAIKLNCEDNSHGVTIKGPPHSAGATYTLTLPNDDGNPNQVLKTNGTGTLSWVDQTSGGAAELDDLTDVSMTAPGDTGSKLVYNNTEWVTSSVKDISFTVGSPGQFPIIDIRNTSIEYHSRIDITTTAGTRLEVIVPAPTQSILGRILEINLNTAGGWQPTSLYTSPSTYAFVDDGNLSNNNYNYQIADYYNVKFKVVLDGSDYKWKAIHRAPIGATGIVDESSTWLIDSNGHFIPKDHDTYDIGLSNQRVRAIHTDDIYVGSSYFTFDSSPTSGNAGVVLRPNSAVSSAPSLKIYHGSNNNNSPELSLQKLYTGVGQTNGRIVFKEDNNHTMGLISSETISVDGSSNPSSTRLDFSTLSNDIDATNASTIGLSIVGDTSSATPKVRIADTWNLPTDAGTSGYVLSTNGSGETAWVPDGGAFEYITSNSNTITLTGTGNKVLIVTTNQLATTRINLPTSPNQGDIIMFGRKATPESNSDPGIQSGQNSNNVALYDSTTATSPIHRIQFTPAGGLIDCIYDGSDWVVPVNRDNVIAAGSSETISEWNFGRDIIYANGGTFSLTLDCYAEDLLEGQCQKIIARGNKTISITKSSNHNTNTATKHGIDIMEPTYNNTTPSHVNTTTVPLNNGIVEIRVVKDPHSSRNKFLISCPGSGGSSVSRPTFETISANNAAITAPSSVDELERVILFKPAGAIAVTLPDIGSVSAINSQDGFKYQLKNASAHQVTVNRAGTNVIDGTLTQLTINSNDNYTIIAVGNNDWVII